VVATQVEILPLIRLVEVRVCALLGVVVAAQALLQISVAPGLAALVELLLAVTL